MVEMKSCRDFDSLVTPYVDGEVTPEQCAAIEAHLSVCPTCHRRADAEAGARMVVRRCRDSLREPAPAALRAACRKLATEWQSVTDGRVTDEGATAGRHATSPTGIPFAGEDGPSRSRPRTNWRVWLPLAATLLLAIAGVVAFGLVSERSTALAQQLATDHLRCVKLTLGKPAADRVQMADRWQRNRGWFVSLPPSSPHDDIEFIALRRCLHGGGEMAHALYRHQGRLVSLFIFPDDGRWGAKREIMGQRATIWSQRGRTYAVVDDGSPADVERLVGFFSRAAE
jgi:anti-sigma factor (TIGR02949 family)